MFIWCVLVWKWSVYPSNAEFEWRNKCFLSIRFWQIEVAYFLTNPFDQVLASLSFGRWVAMALVIESLNTSLDFFWGDAVVDSQIDRGHFEKPVRQTREKRRKNQSGWRPSHVAVGWTQSKDVSQNKGLEDSFRWPTIVVLRESLFQGVLSKCIHFGWWFQDVSRPTWVENDPAFCFWSFQESFHLDKLYQSLSCFIV